MLFILCLQENYFSINRIIKFTMRREMYYQFAFKGLRKSNIKYDILKTCDIYRNSDNIIIMIYTHFTPCSWREFVAWASVSLSLIDVFSFQWSLCPCKYQRRQPFYLKEVLTRWNVSQEAHSHTLSLRGGMGKIK